MATLVSTEALSSRRRALAAAALTTLAGVAGLSGCATPVARAADADAREVDSKASLIQSLLTRSSAFARIDVSQQSVDVVGEVAHVRHVFDADTVPVGRPAAKVHLQVLGVWLRTAAGWQLLARQAVVLPA